VALPRPAGAERFDRIRGLAHAAVRNRERAKSLLVGLTAEFKAAYRGLAKQLVEEGRLSDPDSVYFLFHEELEEIASAASGHPLKRAATQRREVLAYQETLQFPDVGVGLPQPEPLAIISTNERTVVGKPVSRGRVEGLVRVVLTLDEAEALEPGEILVAPITDVGWTPYFAIIGGLVTDVGSAVSHGAVVAREFGLPAVLNTRDGTRILRTGERVVLDGDRGTVERLDVDVESDV
jgi:pyruvate,water dikinase